MRKIEFKMPEKPPKIYFSREVYRPYTSMFIKIKHPGGSDFELLDPRGKVIMQKKRLIEWFYLIHHFVMSGLGTYTANLVKNGKVVASDTAKVIPWWECDEGERFCAGSDLWLCVNRIFQLVEKNSPECKIDGFWNTDTVPCVCRLQEGTYTMLIKKEGYFDWVKEIKIKKGKTTRVTVIMKQKPSEPERPKGYIVCDTTPEGVGIWLRKHEE